MKTYFVSRIVSFSETIKIEAENENDAITQAIHTSVNNKNLTFLDTEYYEAQEADLEIDP